jgi:serine/threonine protein kinase
VEKLEQEAVAGGGFADIFLAVHCQQRVALKRLRVFGYQNDRVRATLRGVRSFLSYIWGRVYTVVFPQLLFKEALTWRELQHPNVLPFLGVDLKTFPGSFCLVSPWMKHGTVLKYIGGRGLSNVNVGRIVCPSHQLTYVLTN